MKPLATVFLSLIIALASTGAFADLELKTGTQIIFPDGTTMDSAAAMAVGHGGDGNTATGTHAYVGGGQFNHGNGDFSAIGAGSSNGAHANHATIGGGQYNAVSSTFGTIGGGTQNEVKSNSNLATIGGGRGHLVEGFYTTVGGGYGNRVYDESSTVGGGAGNEAGSNDADRLSDPYATVAGGNNNSATGGNSAVAGGELNDASANYTTIGGGFYNQASGNFATVPGGNSNEAGGAYSFAAGRKAKATDAGAFVWADSTDADFASIASNEFAVRANGGVRFVTDSDPVHVGVKLDHGDIGWETLSARDSKENFVEVDSERVLEALAAIPILQWNYKHQSAAIKHLGPVAEDFHEAFKLNGEFDGTISTIDADGVALAAIQGLHQQLIEERKRNDALEARLNALEEKLRE